MSKVFAILLIVVCVSSTFINHSPRHHSNKRQRLSHPTSLPTIPQAKCPSALATARAACAADSSCNAVFKNCQIPQDDASFKAIGEQLQGYVKQLFQYSATNNLTGFQTVTQQIQTIYNTSVLDGKADGKAIWKCLNSNGNTNAIQFAEIFDVCVDTPFTQELTAYVEYILQADAKAQATGHITFNPPQLTQSFNTLTSDFEGYQ